LKGIEKEIDDLGRVVLPKNFREKLGIKKRSRVLLVLDEETIIISSADNKCLLCGATDSINKNFRICNQCIKDIKSL
jgi:transcriptional pleiotropic regulator of transition state genes